MRPSGFVPSGGSRSAYHSQDHTSRLALCFTWNHFRWYSPYASVISRGPRRRSAHSASWSSSVVTSSSGVSLSVPRRDCSKLSPPIVARVAAERLVARRDCCVVRKVLDGPQSGCSCFRLLPFSSALHEMLRNTLPAGVLFSDKRPHSRPGI